MTATRLPILVLAPNEWEGPYVNRQQLFSRIGRHRRVVYSNGPWLPHHIGTKPWRNAGLRGTTWATDHVVVERPPMYLVRRAGLPIVTAAVERGLTRRWRRLLGVDGTPFIAYVFHPKFMPLVGAIGATHVVYHAYDWFERYRGWTAQTAAQQRELLRTADLVIASSEMIAEKLTAAGGRTPRVLPNGADVDAFESAARAAQPPAGVAAIPHPRIGYVGSLNRKVNFDLIANLAAKRPEWHFVLLGEIRTSGAEMDAAVHRARARPNVHFFNRVSPHEVPPYVAAMDVNLMVYRLSPDLWVEAGYPLKLHEYLASGQPVVSSDLPSVRPFGDLVTIARTEHDWEAAIDAALQGRGPGSTAARRAVAHDNTWEARVRTLEGWLDGLGTAS